MEKNAETLPAEAPGGRLQLALEELLDYAEERGLLTARDRTWARNQYLELYGETGWPLTDVRGPKRELPAILDELIDLAAERGLVDGTSPAARERFDARLMGLVTPPPSVVHEKFYKIWDEQGREAATDWYYALSRSSHYIHDDRTVRDRRWTTDTAFGTLDITINRSKPEKDPRDIAAAGKAPKSGYPACLLCNENEGYPGHTGHPARQNHRLVELDLQNRNWFMQYSPYVYYNEHCIFLHRDHHPMRIDRNCFDRLLDIVTLLPHYFVGSNADLPIVGGSILAHEHFQGGRFTFAMERAEVEEPVELPGHPGVRAGWVRWPMTVLRLTGADREELAGLAERILAFWRSYTDAEVGIYAETKGEPHSTITPIARRRGVDYELDLVLRNNRTDEEHPLGIFHPRSEYHHIKKENIGLIEVMGLAVLPARLDEELEALRKELAEALAAGESSEKLLARLEANPLTKSHATWAVELAARRHPKPEELEAVLREEVGLVFAKVLEDAGVYKRDEAGLAGRARLTARLQELLR